MRLVGALVIVLAILAQEKASAPTISAELRAKFWRAQADNESAQSRAKAALATVQAVIAELQKTCGERHQVALGQDGEPACQEKK